MTYLVNYNKWKAIHEASNGQLSADTLDIIPTLPGDSSNHKLNPTAADAYSKMVDAAKKDGVTWGITDSYRTLAIQQKLADEKGLYSKGGLAATPGTSNHGWGSAVDLNLAGPGAQRPLSQEQQANYDKSLNWLKANAATYGFSNIPREPWHWEHTASVQDIKGQTQSTAYSANSPSDAQIDAAMAKPNTIQYLKNKDQINALSPENKKELSDSAGMPLAALTDWSSGKMTDREFVATMITTVNSKNKQDITMAQIQSGAKLLKSGSTGDAVTELQKKLKEKGLLTKEPNGEFDKDTYNAVKAFQTASNIGVDGIVGPQTYSALFGSTPNKTVPNTISVAGGKIKSTYTGDKAANINILIGEMEKENLTNPYSQVGILSVIGKESGFIPKSEYSYSGTDNSRLRGIFGARLTRFTDPQLEELKKDNVKFYDVIYGPEAKSFLGWETGNTSPGDGYKYRGRGFNGVTFKYLYDKYGKEVGLDLVNNPDLLNDKATAAKVAVSLLINGVKRLNLDPNSFTNQEDATYAFVKANAGGKEVKGTETYANAKQIEKNFTIDVEPAALA